MGRKPDLIEELKGFKRDLDKAIGISRMILFGSNADGTAGPGSDIDLIIVSEGFDGRDFFKRAAIAYDHWTLHAPVDFLCYTPEEFDKKSRGITIVSHALKHGISIA